MAYYFDPYNYSYVYYPDGTTPPAPDRSGDEYISGFTDEYVSSFPNQPYSQMVGGSTSGSKVVASSANSWVTDTPSSSSSSTSTPATSTPSTPANANDQRNAAEYLNRLFEGWGLEGLSSQVLSWIQDGYDADTIMLMIQDTPEYQKRFAGNTQRQAKGLPVLSPAEYMALERQYRQIMSTAGLPAGFFDSTDDFTGWIAGDVSPAEIQERVSLASNALYSSDSYYLQTLKSYGLGNGDLVAYMLDSKKALPLLQKQVRAAEVGAEAARNSLGITQSRAEYFADLGVTGEQARQAYANISENVGAANRLGALYGESYGQTDLEDELLGGSGLASAKRKRLSLKEASRFSGRSGAGDKALAGRSRGEY